MKKLYPFLGICLLAGFLFACGLSTLPVSPTAPASPAVTVLSPTATPFPPATATAAPPATATPLPSTATATPGLPVFIDQIHMLDETHGWGWASKADSTFQLLRTQDGGLTWNDVSPRGQALNPSTSFFLDTQTAWIAQSDPTANLSTLLRTLDGGQTWVSMPQKDFQEVQNASYTFTTPNDGVAETAGVGAGNLYLNLYRTTDGGATWTPILITAPNADASLPTGTIHLCNICGDSLYYDPQRVVLMYGDLASPPAGVVRLSVSADLGQTWKELNLPLPDPKYAAGMAAPKAPAFWGSEGLLPVNILQYAADNTLAYSVLVIYVTHDGGQTWTPAPAILEGGAAQIEAVESLSAAEIIARCGRDLCVTQDGAQTWQRRASTLNFDPSASSADYVSQFQFINASTGWAISGEGTAIQLWKTVDGGATWTRLAPTLAK
jgi:photosystem II stability/assembly factor-like uncharacterized protein